MIRHADGTPDARYTVTRMGYSPDTLGGYEARFRGEWITLAHNEAEAWEGCKRHQQKRGMAP